MIDFIHPEDVVALEALKKIPVLPSFKKIMEDGVVTGEEIKEQRERVTNLLKKLSKVLHQNR